VVNNGERTLLVYYRKEKVEFWDVDLDEYRMIDLYRDAKASFEKVGIELPKYVDYWFMSLTSRVRWPLNCDAAWIKFVSMWKSEVGAIPIVISKGRHSSMYYYIDKDLDFEKKADIDVGIGSAVEGVGVAVNEGPNPRDVVPTDSVTQGGNVKHAEELEKQTQPTMSEANI